MNIIGLERQALAQLSCASYIDLDEFEFKIRNRNSRTILSIIPTGLLERDKIYRVRLTPGVENLLGGSLDNLAGQPEGTPIDDASGDYIFDFKTLGVIGDERTALVNESCLPLVAMFIWRGFGSYREDNSLFPQRHILLLSV